MNLQNVQVLNDTLRIMKEGSYIKNGKKINLKLSHKQMKEAYVFLPDDINNICGRNDFEHVQVLGRIGVGCENIDSFSMAEEIYKHSFLFSKKKNSNVLVLNLANPVNPGGGVRQGAKAQEEDLCRRSSLLLSLESEMAALYYKYNQSLNTYMGSNAIVITPNVEIIKDVNGELLDEPVIVSIMTCAAPMVIYGKEGLSEGQYQWLLYDRICGMLKCAAYLGYQALVLGAFGCGAFGNDAHVVSDLFYRALKEFDYDGMRAKDFFRIIEFAVLDKTQNKYNYNEFKRNFENFYRDEDNAEIERVKQKMKENEVHLDSIRGCLFGGAVGDALGYPVEFMDDTVIFGKYGKNGITEYNYDRFSGKALISDDTQMALFTANGLIFGDTRGCMRGIQAQLHYYVAEAYQDWLYTQNGTYIDRAQRRDNQISWLCDVPELYSRRAPGNTCISALSKTGGKGYGADLLKNPVNNSKGCGGIMRIAPLALNYETNMEWLDMEAAYIAAITHGHSLGYMSAAVLCHIINRIVFSKDKYFSLNEIVMEAKTTVESLFAGDEYLSELLAIIDKAILLSKNNENDIDNIRKLGQGWVAEETLAIAIYCSLKYSNDFSRGIIAAVNHSGDSDSTGAVTGNILGALFGYSAIEDKWKDNLECSDVILEIADDLCHGCQMSEYSSYYDADWACKYIDRQWKKHEPKCLFFWHEHGVNGYLSNKYESEFIIDDFCYKNVEQYLMAQKAKLFHDAKCYTAILKTDFVDEYRQIGRRVYPFNEEVWETNRYRILKEGVLAKFSQNEVLKKELLATGDCIIAKASPYDSIFGIKLANVDAEKILPEKWPGRNLLGKALMEVRSELSLGMNSTE